MRLSRAIVTGVIVGSILGNFAHAHKLFAQSSVRMVQGEDDTLKALSLEELLQIHVTSANRREESVADVSAALTVITREDIRRSGVRNIADALR